MILRRTRLVGAVTVVIILSGAASAFADFSGGTDLLGTTTVGMSKAERSSLKAELAQMVSAGGPRYDYKVTIAGCDIGGGSGANSICYDASIQACINNDPSFGLGPLSDIRRRMVDQDGGVMLNGKVATPAELAAAPNQGWDLIGVTCFPQDMPGSAPIPSVEMIVKAFHLTPWAKGAISTQPKGNTTLVNLKTFFNVDWSAAGYEPGEVDALDPATMFGFRVDVRPKLVGFVYHFGDGESEGPTTSLGGVYPDGDIVHAYRKPGTYQTSVEATFGADFRINGGAWLNLPTTVVVQQPATPVTVREARAVLVQQ